MPHSGCVSHRRSSRREPSDPMLSSISMNPGWGESPAAAIRLTTTDRTSSRFEVTGRPQDNLRGTTVHIPRPRCVGQGRFPRTKVLLWSSPLFLRARVHNEHFPLLQVVQNFPFFLQRWPSVADACTTVFGTRISCRSLATDELREEKHLQFS